jgi:transcriptional regulator with XRE-family HTH domain
MFADSPLLQKITKTKGVRMSFGYCIREARKKAGLSLKALADRVEKNDGATMSPQFLHDIEIGRRHPPTDHKLDGLANELSLSREYLQFLAGGYPEDLQELFPQPTPEQVEAAFRAFRQVVKGQTKEI